MMPSSAAPLLFNIVVGEPCKVTPSFASAWTRIGVATIGATVFPQAPEREHQQSGHLGTSLNKWTVVPPCPIELPSTFQVRYRLPLSLYPDASIAPPAAKLQIRALLLVGVYGPVMLVALAAPTQCLDVSEAVVAL